MSMELLLRVVAWDVMLVLCERVIKGTGHDA